MKHRLMLLAGLAVGVFGLSSAPALSQTQGRGEIGLVGIKLYDTGLKVVQIYGSPSTIEVVGVGGGSIGPSGGGRPGGGPPMGAGGGMGGRPGGGAPGGGKMGPGPSALENRPGGIGSFGFADDLLSMQEMAAAAQSPTSSNAPAGGGGGGGGGFGGGGGAASGSGIKFTRWVFNRPGSKYAFVLDRFNRVVQIEAIGISDPKVRSARGVGFGTSFSQIMKLYGAPDGYEINGDNIVMRYLQRNKIAFRLSRLGTSKSHQVTGVVVAGGKA